MPEKKESYLFGSSLRSACIRAFVVSKKNEIAPAIA